MKITIDNKKRRLDQWDTGQRLILEGIPAGTHVDFARPGTEPLGREAYEQDGVIYVNIPNTILQTAGSFGTWFYVRDGDRGETVRFWPGSVFPRPKPADYICTDEELKAWEQLHEEIDLRHQFDHGKPGTDTAGAVGGFYMDLDSGDVYKCVAAEDGMYQWVGLIEKNYVIYNAPQSLTEHHRMRARINIGAASAAELEALKNKAAAGIAVQTDAPADKSMLWIDPDDDAGGSASGFAVQSEAPDDKSVLWVDPDDTTGSDGTNGKSAYELAQDAGFEGTVEEWLEFLKGADGAPGGDGQDGAPGKSAYEYAREAGYKGTEAEFAQKLARKVPSKLSELSNDLVSGASVGQTVRITAVDEKGVPTAWEAVEMPSGGGNNNNGAVSSWTLINEVTLEESARKITIDADADGNAFAYDEIAILAFTKGDGDCSTNVAIKACEHPEYLDYEHELSWSVSTTTTGGGRWWAQIIHFDGIHWNFIVSQKSTYIANAQVGVYADICSEKYAKYTAQPTGKCKGVSVYPYKTEISFVAGTKVAIFGR